MSVIGKPATHFDRYDWAMLAATAATMSATILLGAPLWAGVIVAVSGSAIMGFRGACRNLGLFGHRDVEEPETASLGAAACLPASTPSSTAAHPRAATQPSTVSLPPRATSRP